LQGKGAGSYSLLVKGAPEMLLERCTQAMMSDGSIVKLDDAMRKAVIAKVENDYNSNQQALRCLAMAYKEGVDPTDKRLADTSKFKDVESDLIFVGVAGEMQFLLILNSWYFMSIHKIEIPKGPRNLLFI
jgi:magnesium-transporting ATPase (P-type)